MDIKICVAGLCLAVIAATALAVAPVEAQTSQRQVYTTRSNPPVNRPRARVTVAPRSFLDAGTEVLPGDRKFTDYAFPPGPYSTPLSVVSNPIHWIASNPGKPCSATVGKSGSCASRLRLPVAIARSAPV